MLGTIIEQMEMDSWNNHICQLDAITYRRSCPTKLCHRDATMQELDDMLGEYDFKRDLVEINHKARQWSHNAVWNKKYMEPRPGSPWDSYGRNRNMPLHKNTNLLRGARHWHPPSGNGRLSHASCHTVCQRIPGCTRNPALLAIPAVNWITSAASHWRVGTEPMWEQSGGNPWADAGRETRPHQEGWRRNAHCHRTR